MQLAEKREVGRTLTLLLIFLVTVIAIVVIFGYFTNFLHFGTPTKDVQISAVISIQGGGGSYATLAFSITNLSSTDLTGVTFSCPPGQFSSATCNSLSVDVNGLPVSSQNPVLNKQTASGAGTVTAAAGVTFNPGQAYTVKVNLSFADGTTLTVSELLPAQA